MSVGAGICAVVFAGVLVRLRWAAYSGSVVRPLEAESVSLVVIARELFSTYILPFEMIGLLLLVAVVAASWVAQKPEPGESGESPHALAEPDAPAEGVGTAKQGVPR